MIRVVIEDYGALEAPRGATLLEVCEAHAVPMDSACGGFACCNSCRVFVLCGAPNLSEIDPEERAFLDAPEQRLGCQAQVLGPVSVRLDPGTS